jgi:ectoine hydroxylase-related dioxygenase (phytanoyl-CoA dioxygenase family)
MLLPASDDYTLELKSQVSRISGEAESKQRFEATVEEINDQPPHQHDRSGLFFNPSAVFFVPFLPDRGSSSKPLNMLNVDVSQMLYEEREKSIEARGAFEEELIGEGGAALEACAPDLFASELLTEGVGRCNGVLDPDQAATLKTFISEALAKAQEDTSSGKVPPKHRFAEVLLKENRWDLLLPLDDDRVLGAARAIASSPIGDAIVEILGEDAVVHECSCLISDYGSPRQVLHPDTPQHETGETPLLTCFTALQDVKDHHMGPTLFLPKTQDKVSHLRFFNEVVKDELLKENAEHRKIGQLSIGDVSVFDSRTLHAGTANRAPGTRRAMFYLSFRNPRVADPGNPQSIRPCFANGLTLSDLRGNSAKKKAKTLARDDIRPAASKLKKKKKKGGFG